MSLVKKHSAQMHFVKGMISLICIWLFLVVYPVTCMSQSIGINSTGAAPTVGSGLDITYANKGLLIPRVSLASSADLMGNASLTEGLIVYKKDLVGWGAAIGYYYWNGTLWVRFGAATGLGWDLLGNAGTTAGTHFLGTTDAIDFVIRTNNKQAMKVYSSGSVWIRDNAPYTAPMTPSPANVKLVVNGHLAVVGNAGISAYANGNTTNSGVDGLWRLSFGGNVGWDSVGLRFFNLGDGTANGGWGLIGSNVRGTTNARTYMGFFVFPSGGVGTRTHTTAGTLSYEAMRLLEGGQISIGTPVNKFGCGTCAATLTFPFNMSQAAHITTGTILSLAGTTADQVEGGRIRFQETLTDFQGAYSHYNAFTNTLHFGAHNNADQLTASDINAISILGSNGYVGINNTNPQDQLDVTGNIRIASLAGTGTRIVTASTLGTLAFPAGNIGQVMLGTGALGGVPGTTSWALNGNAGTVADGTNFIGTTDPVDFVIKTNSAEKMRVTSGGNVGIATTAPSEKLEVCGNVKIIGTINASGVITPSNGAITCSSDLRYKKDITPLANTLDNIMKLRGVNYFWKQEEFPEKYFNDKKQIGVIAQEVEKIYPELVFTDKTGFKSVDYSRFTPILIEAFKELNAKHEQLQAITQSSMIPKQGAVNDEIAKRLELLEKKQANIK